MKYKRTFNLLGLCTRSGKCRFGVECCRADAMKGVSKLIVVNDQLSGNSREKLVPLCEAKGIAVLVIPDEGDTLGEAVGRPGAKTISINDGQFARSIIDTFNLEDVSHTGGGAETYVENKNI